jgi:hypothetical protein
LAETLWIFVDDCAKPFSKMTGNFLLIRNNGPSEKNWTTPIILNAVQRAETTTPPGNDG